MDVLTTILFVVGLVLLIGGGEVLVRGASSLAIAIGISPLVVGLTVVAFGTSAPELAVAVQSALVGQPDIALGNVVGSNIANILLILGLSALVGPLMVRRQLLYIDVPVMLACSVAMYVMALDGQISRLEGVLLAFSLIVYIAWSVYHSRKKQAAREASAAEQSGSQQAATTDESSAGTSRKNSLLVDLLLVAAGAGMIVLGANWLVNGAVTFARAMGVSELVIGLTVIAIGTSLPEIATSIIASYRGERDIAIGNVIGSNIFNILSVLGLTAAIAPTGISVAANAIWFDMPVMLLISFICLPVFITHFSISRWEGALFLGLYVAYMLFLVLNAINSAFLMAYSIALIVLVPAVCIILVVLLVRFLRTERQSGQPSVSQ